MYAIIETGSKQYRVKPGDIIDIEKLDHEEEQIVFDRILAVKTDAGLQVGKPTLEGITVVGNLVGEVKGEKVIVFKKKRRKQYKRKTGHRQQFLRIKIESIEGV